jgi:ATP-dependent DNA helicase RecG
VVERSGRGKIILSRKFYAFLGEKGVHTRKKGLDRETEKELLLKHLEAAGSEGVRRQVLWDGLRLLRREALARLLLEVRRLSSGGAIIVV